MPTVTMQTSSVVRQTTGKQVQYGAYTDLAANTVEFPISGCRTRTCIAPPRGRHRLVHLSSPIRPVLRMLTWAWFRLPQPAAPRVSAKSSCARNPIALVRQ